MYRSNAETIYELSTFPRFYPLLTTAQTFEITALSSRRALKMFLFQNRWFAICIELMGQFLMHCTCFYTPHLGFYITYVIASINS